MADRYPGYDVLRKYDSESWNDQTRRVIDQRLALTEGTDVLAAEQRRTLNAVADRIVPQPENRPPVNTVAILLDKIGGSEGDGYRHHALPPLREAWARGLDAIEAEAQERFGRSFHTLDGGRADAILHAVEAGETQSQAWSDLPPHVFFSWRLIPDLVSAYYAHPSAWSAMGFGGPAAPRGYVRILENRRDPWEAAEEGDGSLIPARIRNQHAR